MGGGDGDWERGVGGGERFVKDPDDGVGEKV